MSRPSRTASSGRILAWKVEYKQGVLKDVSGLDRQVQRRLKKFIEELSRQDDPRMKGKPLRGAERLWRYRVGDYRIVCEILDQNITIYVIRIGHRKDIYL